MIQTLVIILILVLCVPSAISKARWYYTVNEFIKRNHGGDK